MLGHAFMHLTPQKILWLTPTTLEIFTAGAMLWHRKWREYPWFYGYLLSEVIRTAALFSIGTDSRHYATYFYTYWATEAVLSTLGFFVIAEIFDHAFSDRFGLKQWRRSIFRFALMVLIVAAVFVSFISHGGEPSRLMAAVLILKRSESLIRLGLIAALFIFVSILGLPWTSQTIGITFGLALYGVVEIIGIGVRFHYGSGVNRMVSLSGMLAACCQTLIWAAYFGRSRSLAKTNPEQSELIASGTHGLAVNQEAVKILMERQC
jgi:hypothetical protein